MTRVHRIVYTATQGPYTFTSWRWNNSIDTTDRLMVHVGDELILRKYDDLPRTDDMSLVGRPVELLQWAKTLTEKQIGELQLEYIEKNPKWENSNVSGSYMGDVDRNTLRVNVDLITPKVTRLTTEQRRSEPVDARNAYDAVAISKIMLAMFGIRPDTTMTFKDFCATDFEMAGHREIMELYRIKHRGWANYWYPNCKGVQLSEQILRLLGTPEQ